MGATVEDRGKAVVEELRELQNRRNLLAEVVGEMSDTKAQAPVQKQIAEWDKAIEQKKIEIQEMVPEFKLRGVITDIAEEYVSKIQKAYEDAGVEMKRLPTPNEDGTVSGLPRVPGLSLDGDRRTRASVKGKTLDLSNLAPSISHSFRGGDTITANLDFEARDRLDGTVLTTKASTLLDELYKTDSGSGFYDAITSEGATQSALTIFTGKAGGVLMDGGEDVSDGVDEDDDDDTDISSNGHK